MVEGLGRARRAGGVARSGQALIVAALMMTALLGMVALSVDAGNLWLRTRRLQGLADAAALAGAQQWLLDQANPPGRLKTSVDDPTGYAALDAANYLTYYGYSCPSADCIIETPVAAYGAEGNQYIRVEIYQRVPFTFARVLGFNEQRIKAVATARGFRKRPSGEAIVAFNGVTVELTGATASTYRVVGGIASWGTISSTGGNKLQPTEGEAYAGGTITSSLIEPPSAAHPNTPGMPGLYPDPIAGKVTFPSFPGPINSGPPFYCGTLNRPRPNADPDIREPVPYGGDVTLEEGGKYLLRPGSYCSITINHADVKLRDGNYFVANDFKASDSGTGNQAEISMETSPLKDSQGIYLAARGSIEFFRTAHFEIKGRSNLLDVGFHIPSPHTGSVSLTNSTPSNLVGSIYAPNGTVLIRGNPGPSTGGIARVTRSQSSTETLTARGGRVVANTVRLQINVPDSSYHSWGLDYPPVDEDYTAMPALVPASP
jgi:hypothetical protein